MKFMIAYATISAIMFVYTMCKLKRNRTLDGWIKYIIMGIMSGLCFTLSVSYVIAWGPLGTWIIKHFF